MRTFLTIALLAAAASTFGASVTPISSTAVAGTQHTYCGVPFCPPSEGAESLARLKVLAKRDNGLSCKVLHQPSRLLRATCQRGDGVHLSTGEAGSSPPSPHTGPATGPGE